MGAELFIDGKYRGKTPIIIKNLVANRLYKIDIQKEGYKAIKKSIILESNKELKINVKLEPLKPNFNAFLF